MTTAEHAQAVEASAGPALAGIQHVGLTVCDVEASTDWYVRVLGLQRQFEEPHHHSDQGGYAVVLGTPDMSLNVGLDHHPANSGEAFDPNTDGPRSRLLSRRRHRHARCLGCTPRSAERSHSGVYAMEGTPFWLLTFDDPDGIQLELIAFAG